MKTNVFRLTFVLMLALMLSASRLPTRAHVVPNAPTATNVCGNISTNTTWLQINSPYEVCNGGVTIGPTATLTIQPGVTVQFFRANSSCM
jgi:hypothetical protein